MEYDNLCIVLRKKKIEIWIVECKIWAACQEYLRSRVFQTSEP